MLYEDKHEIVLNTIVIHECSLLGRFHKKLGSLLQAWTPINQLQDHVIFLKKG